MNGYMKLALLLLCFLGGAALGVKFEHAEVVKVELEYSQKIAKQKTEAAAVLDKETKRADAATAVAANLRATQEMKDADNLKLVQALQLDLRTAHARSAGRMRDPNAAGCGSGSGVPAPQSPASASGGTTDGPAAGGLLSESLTGLLDKLTFEADKINVAYIACRADNAALRAFLTEPEVK
jgi:hypothetical protein